MAKFKVGDKVRIKTAGCGWNKNPVGTEGEVVSVSTFKGNEVATVALPRGSHGWTGEGNVPHWNFGMPNDTYPADHWLELVQTQPIPVGANPPEDKVVSKPLQVGDKVKTSAGFVGEVVGFAVDGEPSVLVRATDGWRNGHNGSVTELLPGHGEVAMRGFMGGYWFFEPEGLERLSLRVGDRVKLASALKYKDDAPVGAKGTVRGIYQNGIITVEFDPDSGFEGWEAKRPHDDFDSAGKTCWNFVTDEDRSRLELIHDEKPKADEPKKVESILEEALRVTGGDRRRDYGSAKVNHDRIALLWAAWDVISSGSDEEIAAALSAIRPLAPEYRELDSARDVAMKMILLKIAREANTPKRDNKVDMAGYARCLSQIDGEEGEF